MDNLLTEIAGILQEVSMQEGIEGKYYCGLDSKYAKQILAKVREVVEGINSIDYPYGADFKRAVIKALEV